MKNKNYLKAIRNASLAGLAVSYLGCSSLIKERCEVYDSKGKERKVSCSLADLEERYRRIVESEKIEYEYSRGEKIEGDEDINKEARRRFEEKFFGKSEVEDEKPAQTSEPIKKPFPETPYRLVDRALVYRTKDGGYEVIIDNKGGKIYGKDEKDFNLNVRLNGGVWSDLNEVIFVGNDALEQRGFHRPLYLSLSDNLSEQELKQRTKELDDISLNPYVRADNSGLEAGLETGFTFGPQKRKRRNKVVKFFRAIGPEFCGNESWNENPWFCSISLGAKLVGTAFAIQYLTQDGDHDNERTHTTTTRTTTSGGKGNKPKPTPTTTTTIPPEEPTNPDDFDWGDGNPTGE